MFVQSYKINDLTTNALEGAQWGAEAGFGGLLIYGFNMNLRALQQVTSNHQFEAS